MGNRRTAVLILLLQWICVLNFTTSGFGSESLGTVRNVLLLNSYNQKMSWVEDIVQGVYDVLKPDENDLTVHIENMDTKVFFSAEYFESFRNYLQVKYRDTTFSLILSSDNNAYDFLRAHRDTLFPGVPVSFCGVNGFDPAQLEGLDSFTGVIELFSARQTVELALKLHPEATGLFIVNDHLKTGKAWKRDITRELEGLDKRITILYSPDVSIDTLREQIASLGPEYLVLLGVFFADSDGRYFTYERVGALLSEVSRVPVYCLLEFNIGKGIVGGKVISGYYQGKTMAEIGRKILDGTDAGTIPVVMEGSNRDVYDFSQLERFGISESNLPPSSLIINRPFSFYQTYKLQVWLVTLFFTLLLLTIAGLIISMGRRKQAETELQGSEARFRQLANATWEAVVVHDQGMFFHANDPFYTLFGYEKGELDGKQVIPLIIAPDSVDDVLRRIEEKRVEPYETTARRSTGEEFPVEIRARQMEYSGRDVRMAAIRDLSGRKRMEQRLSQSQKLEAIGTLAGGIAHDFNNILSAIIGYCELSNLEVPKDSKASKYLGEMLKAGNRAKDLVQQILTFARKSTEEKEAVPVAPIISEALKLLRASLPTSISIVKNLNTDAKVLSDTTKIHQILMNLCTNGGKAMPDGGTLTVNLEKLYLDEEFITKNLGHTPGDHVKLTVTDTGIGIPKEDLPKIFDPFFTTRRKEEGTGLGLSVVHGIVRDCHGFVTVTSEPGKGSEFSVYLPVIDVAVSHRAGTVDNLPGGDETILVVDDETVLVEMMSDMLTRLGYTVESFTSSIEAFHAFTKQPEKFDLVISDMTMPIMSGDKLAEELLAVRPDIPIILNTGFTDKITEQEALDMGIKRFIMKPVKINQLADTIRDVLVE